MQEKAIVFALAQTSYGACVFLGYWGYFLLIHVIKSSDLFPFRLVRYQLYVTPTIGSFAFSTCRKR